MSSMVRLRPTARPVRRAPGEVQFGLSPTHGIVLAGLSEAESEMLLSLADTAGTARDVTLAQRYSIPLERVAEFIDALRGHGLLVTAAASDSTHHACVPGQGTVVELVREHLESAGVELVAAPGSSPPPSVDLALLCSPDAIAPDEGVAWQRSGTPHLPVVLRDGEVVIGPLIHPGRSACLRCLDLHRRDRDHAWPRILAQLGTPTSDLGRVVDAAPGQAATVAALVAMVSQECLINPESALGISWHVSLPWPQVCTRFWSPHPHCDCLTP